MNEKISVEKQSAEGSFAERLKENVDKVEEQAIQTQTVFSPSTRLDAPRGREMLAIRTDHRSLGERENRARIGFGRMEKPNSSTRDRSQSGESPPSSGLTTDVHLSRPPIRLNCKCKKRCENAIRPIRRPCRSEPISRNSCCRVIRSGVTRRITQRTVDRIGHSSTSASTWLLAESLPRHRK